MPAVHTAHFKVRYYECDAYGHANNINYIHYMQEAAFDASAAVGYGMEEYAELGHFWLPRQHIIEFLKPLGYNDRFEVRTWVVDARRVRCRRIYEFRLAGQDELVARSFTDWVYVNPHTGRPASIPDNMLTAFFPDDDPPAAPRRPGFPTPPTAPDQLAVFPHRVGWEDIDPTVHTNSARYLSFMEAAGVQVMEQFGWPLRRLLDAGLGLALRQVHIEFVQEALLDDELEISSYFSDPKNSSFTRWCFIRRAGSGELVTQGKLDYVMIDLDTGRPTPLPAEMFADLAPILSVASA